MDCIGQTDASVRSGGAGDPGSAGGFAEASAGRIGKPSRRGNRVCLADPEGRVFNTRLGSLGMSGPDGRRDRELLTNPP